MVEMGEGFVGWEGKRAGWGDEFLTAVQSALDIIVTHPTRYPAIHRNTRRALVHRFPYQIFYRVYDDIVVVVACMHGRRDPLRWKSRT